MPECPQKGEDRSVSAKAVKHAVLIKLARTLLSRTGTTCCSTITLSSDAQCQAAKHLLRIRAAFGCAVRRALLDRFRSLCPGLIDMTKRAVGAACPDHMPLPLPLGRSDFIAGTTAKGRRFFGLLSPLSSPLPESSLPGAFPALAEQHRPDDQPDMTFDVIERITRPM
jgi:hypothetical protein